MLTHKDIMLTVDYHDENLVIRRLDGATGEERILKEPTSPEAIRRVVEQAKKELEPEGQILWIMESTTGWARVKELFLPDRRKHRLSFHLCNPLEMPLPPKGHRKKTDKVDTGRMQREALAGKLPEAFQPPRWLRRLRRLVSLRENLVARRTALRNWFTRYLAHETWEDRTHLWTVRGMARLEALARKVHGPDKVVLSIKLAELKNHPSLLKPVEEKILRMYKYLPQAQLLDEIRGLGPIASVSIVSRIIPVTRFSNNEKLIGFAGLAPSIRQSDETLKRGHIGGGGTDKHLRHYLIEASVWARQIPRYRPTYERVMAKRGKKIARLVVARMMLRSIYKMLKDNIRFNQLPARPAKTRSTIKRKAG
jgi:transposase